LITCFETIFGLRSDAVAMDYVARDPAAAAISASQARRKQVTLGNAMYEQPCAVRGAQQESKRPVS
jgi:hypothetical protein